MPIDFATQVSLLMNTTSALTVTSGGAMLAPGQPNFNVMSAQATAAGADVIPGGTLLLNDGSLYNATNGRFTAASAGTYYVRFNQLAQNATLGEFRTAIYVNGVAYGGSRFIMYKNVASWWTLIAEAHVKLAVNDYITVRYESGGAALYTDSNYASFSGHFIG